MFSIKQTHVTTLLILFDDKTEFRTSAHRKSWPILPNGFIKVTNFIGKLAVSWVSHKSFLNSHGSFIKPFLANYYSARKGHEMAQDFLKRALKLHPTNASIWVLLGHVCIPILFLFTFLFD